MQQEEVRLEQYASAQVIAPLLIFIEPIPLTTTCRVTLRSSLLFWHHSSPTPSRAYTPTGEEQPRVTHVDVRTYEISDDPTNPHIRTAPRRCESSSSPIPFPFHARSNLYAELYCQVAGYYLRPPNNTISWQSYRPGLD
jgi:hypothetical protein